MSVFRCGEADRSEQRALDSASDEPSGYHSLGQGSDLPGLANKEQAIKNAGNLRPHSTSKHILTIG